MSKAIRYFRDSEATVAAGLPASGRSGEWLCRLCLKLLPVIGLVGVTVVCGYASGVEGGGLALVYQNAEEHKVCKEAALQALPLPLIRYVATIEEAENDRRRLAMPSFVMDRSLRGHSYAAQAPTKGTQGSWAMFLAAARYLLPPVCGAKWLTALYAMLIGGVFWAVHQWRVGQLHHHFELALDARVCERARIARELHDTLLQSFHGALLQFQLVSESLPERPTDAKEQLNTAMEQAADAITQGREVVQGLRDSTVEGNNLTVALNTFAQDLLTKAPNGNSADFQMIVEGTPHALRPIVLDEIYKIAAEALRNIFRHAEAERVELEIHYGKEEFRLRVRDDGKGIDPAILVRENGQGHYGLQGMRERATLIGGRLMVWSEISSGTEVELRVPAIAAFARGRRDSWFTRKFAAVSR